jgi:uncharacterized metal-binding protein YceD (DUF177 family)
MLDLTAVFSVEEEGCVLRVDSSDLQLIKAEDFFLLRGKLSIELDTVCDRCADDITIVAADNFSVCVKPGSPFGNSLEHELTDEDGEFYFTDPEFIDLHDILRQEAYYILPTRRVCSKCGDFVETGDVDINKKNFIGAFDALLRLKDK